MSLSCPSCASDNTQKVSLAYNSGTNNISATTIGFSRRGVGIAATSGASQSQLATNCAPPKRKQAGAAGCLIILGLVLGGVAAAVLDSELIFWAILGGAFLGSYLIGRDAYRFNREEYPKLYARWQGLSLCLRCGNIFDETPPMKSAALRERFSSTEMRSSSPPALPQSQFSVRLISVGPRTISVIRAVQEVTGARASEAKSIVERTPSLIGVYRSRNEADAARMKLIETGAMVVVESSQEPAGNPPI